MHKYSILTWLISGYVAFIAFWLLSRALVFDQVWLLALLNTVAEYLFLPLPVLVFLSLLKRHKPSLLLLSLPIVAFMGLFGELFWSSPSKPADLPPGSIITAMSFNVLYSNEDYDAIADSIRSASPDLIGFQELGRPQAQAIAQRLEAEFPYSTLQKLERGQGAGLLSRFPLETAESFSLPPRDFAMRATIRVDGIRVHVFVVHLTPNNFFQDPTTELIPQVVERYGQRAAEVNRLEAEITALTEPVVLMCDCNLTDTSEAYFHLDSFLHDSFREVGWGLGHTVQPPQFPFPVQRVDYVWHSDDFVALDAFVGQAGESDHLPMVARLKLLETP